MYDSPYFSTVTERVNSCPQDCVGANPGKRPNPEDLVKNLRRSPGYFKNELIDVLVFLEEIQFKVSISLAKTQARAAIQKYFLQICLQICVSSVIFYVLRRILTEQEALLMKFLPFM